MGLPPAPRSPWRPTEDPAADIRFLRPGERGAQQQLSQQRGAAAATESSSCDDLDAAKHKLRKVRKTMFWEEKRTDPPKRAKDGTRGGCASYLLSSDALGFWSGGLPSSRHADRASEVRSAVSDVAMWSFSRFQQCVGRESATANGVSTLIVGPIGVSLQHCNLCTRKDSSADNIICRSRPRRCSAHTRRLTRAHSR